MPDLSLTPSLFIALPPFLEKREVEVKAKFLEWRKRQWQHHA